MTQIDIAAAVQQHVGPLTPLLDDTIAEAIDDAERRNSGLSHAKHPYLRSMTVRALAREALESGPLPTGWEVAGNPVHMGELYLRKPGLMSLRFLKGNPARPGGIPHAGRNDARQRFWCQDALPEDGLALPDAELSFLLLWSYDDISDRTSGFSLTLAHTLEPGRFGQRVPCDLVLDIPRGGTLFEDLRPFANDEDEDLFSRQIDIHDAPDEVL